MSKAITVAARRILAGRRKTSMAGAKARFPYMAVTFSAGGTRAVYADVALRGYAAVARLRRGQRWSRDVIHTSSA